MEYPASEYCWEMSMKHLTRGVRIDDLMIKALFSILD